jgi:hypothetical protein
VRQCALVKNAIHVSVKVHSQGTARNKRVICAGCFAKSLEREWS